MNTYIRSTKLHTFCLIIIIVVLFFTLFLLLFQSAQHINQLVGGVFHIDGF